MASSHGIFSNQKCGIRRTSLFSSNLLPMSDITPQLFAQRISDLGLADRRSVEQAVGELGVGDHSLDDMIRVMQRRGLVTTLQTDKILKGDRYGFFYGDYKVLYVIGAGTFARVYRAEKDGEVFAVKVLRKRFRDEIKELEQFLREGRMGLKLRHPHIVSIVDVVPDTRNPFLVMEFIEGQTLRELVKIRGKLPTDLAMRFLYEVASGLAYASSLGIAHRDLKLSNVLISSDGKAKLVDFGLAALQAEVKKAIEILEGGHKLRRDSDFAAPMAEHHDDDELPTNEGEGYVVMLVESKAGLQNAIREKLKTRGYRVLVISDPNRALARFSVDEDPPADCVIFGASELGSLAMEAFNNFADEEHTKDIPSVLLVDKKQTQVIADARRGSKRKMLTLPLKVRELRAALIQLLTGVERRQLGTY